MYTPPENYITDPTLDSSSKVRNFNKIWQMNGVLIWYAYLAGKTVAVIGLLLVLVQLSSTRKLVKHTEHLRKGFWRQKWKYLLFGDFAKNIAFLFTCWCPWDQSLRIDHLWLLPSPPLVHFHPHPSPSPHRMLDCSLRATCDRSDLRIILLLVCSSLVSPVQEALQPIFKLFCTRLKR